MVAAVFVLFITSPDPEPTGPDPDLAEVVREHTDGLRPDARYRPPDDAERHAFVRGLRALGVGQDAEALRALGFSVDVGTDRATGRRFALAVNAAGERAWGLYLIDLSEPSRLLVEVPHPNYDLRTEVVGLALWRAVPGSLLAVSGTHRKAANGAGDVAHRADSMFHALATDFAERGVAQVQLHGFDDASLPGEEVVLSVGTDSPGPAAQRAADRMSDAGLAVCLPWRTTCGRLEGTRNKQGIAAAGADSLFLHVEMNRSVRDSRTEWTAVVDALAGADLTRG
ncbi:hypothetical protein SAMN05192558_11795 [Actinokineospora alba]|uniref:Uncharacterized protein n=1 Tax=Actinokineospora alba TaxID=504798 RepID=A0A1H0W3Z7_9PSEU|nr:hypothetical protein C8E96_3403 [Actinokineospora alba]SDI73007.1 hypothetical protein SAMN05421871_10795 [Actinokineospora alba]SDP85459.1 hypothetical protein SAMN05192558_11795 [Actinokineospora alba]